MRNLTYLLAFLALAAGFVLLDRLTAPRVSAGPTPASAEALRITEALANRAGLAVEGVVLGMGDGEERDFRGLYSADGRLRPVYGRARARCPGRTAPTCWEITYLEIDGRRVAEHVAAVTIEIDPPDDGPEAEIETADTLVVDRGAASGGSVPALVPTAAPGGSLPAPDGRGPTVAGSDDVPMPAARPGHSGNDAGTARRPTHRVARPVINVRNGPGTDRAVIARLPEGMRLALIDRREDWGRFLVLEGEASGREVWAALDILQPVP